MNRGQFINRVEESQRALRRFLVALCCGDSQLADDIAQETYIKAFLSYETLKDESKFNSWIFRIANNVFLDHKRAACVTVGVDEANNLAGPESSDSNFRYQDLYEALDRLPDKERTSVLLFYMQGYSVKEISEITGATQEAVRQHLSRGRIHLRGMLDQND